MYRPSPMMLANSLSISTVFILLIFIGCAPGGPVPDRSPGISWDLAQHRARTLSDIRYELTLSIPERTEDPVLGEMTIRFERTEDGGDLVIDFMPSGEHVTSVSVSGAPAMYEVKNEHIIVPGAALKTGANEVGISFTAGNSSLNRNDEFLYTLFVPDRARFAIPCFDQPNLKARVSLTLKTPLSWKAVANGPLVEHTQSESTATYRFGETKPISTYLIAFAAGVFQTETAMRSGRSMTMYHRETDAEKVAQNREEVFNLHEAALNWLESYTNIPYPFAKFDFVLIPAFQYGGMEHPGAVFYKDTGILHDEVTTQNQKLGRAGLIAHETAHMWFGDLVTMNWFDDVWTKEVFANFMSAKIVNPSFPDVNHELRFLSHYPGAYNVDRTAGANPIRQPLENLNMAGTLYGSIIYAKAPIVMKHLEILVGEDTFREGMREYLSRYQFENATWPQLIDILDGLSEENLKVWSKVWVEEPGRPIVRTKISFNEEKKIRTLTLEQSDPGNSDRYWNQRLSVLLSFPGSAETIEVRLQEAAATIDSAAGKPAPDYILPNGNGVGYGLFKLDTSSKSYLLEHFHEIPNPLHRGIAWITLREEMLEGDVSAEDLLAVGTKALDSETDELMIQRILGTVTGAYWRYIVPETRDAWASELEGLFIDKLNTTESPSLKASFFNAYRSVVLTEGGIEFIRSVWNEKHRIPGLKFSERDFIGMAQLLAVRGVPDAAEILEIQRSRIKNPDRLARFEFVMPALSQDKEHRDRFFDSLSAEENRTREPWVLESLRFLHHPLRAEESGRYILPALELLEEIQRTGDIFFPKRWLDATLAGHQTGSASEVVTRFLEQNPGYSPRLKAKILQSADGLIRASRILQSQ